LMMKAISPEAFAKEMGWAPKRVRRLAKKLGACRILGNRMALMPEDVQTILEATKPCPSNSLSVTEIDTTGGLDYEDRLAQRTARSRRALRPRSKTDSTNVISMDRKKS